MVTEQVQPSTIEMTFDGVALHAVAGQTLSAALINSGIRTWGTSRVGRAPRGIYCGMGICHGCLVEFNGRPNTRACLVIVQDGDTVSTQEGTGHDDLA